MRPTSPQVIDPQQRLVSALRVLGELSAADEEQVRQLPMRVQQVMAHHQVLREGDRLTECSLVLDGFFFRHTLVAEHQRQILSLDLPGDIPDLQSLHMPVSDFSLSALTSGALAHIPHGALRRALSQSPGLVDLFWRMTLLDAAIMRRRVESMGRRSGYQRIAHLFCEVFTRLNALGLTSEDGFTLPITQNDLGDATGLSTVHVNRTLQQLRHEGLIVSRGKWHGFTDWERLCRAGDFDSAYLRMSA